MKSYILVSISLLLCSCQAKLPVNVPELSDGNPTTCFVGTEGVNKVIFDEQYTVPIQSYKIYSSGETPVHDPCAWILKGSYDGKTGWLWMNGKTRRSVHAIRKFFVR